MLEIYKRCWQVFFPLFTLFGLGSLQAFYYLHEYKYQWFVIAILLVLAIICLIIGIVASVYVIKDGRKKDRERKDKTDYQALVESFKFGYIKQGKSPEEAQKLAEIAAAGDTEPYQPVDGLEDDGWVSIREVHNKLCRKKK